MMDQIGSNGAQPREEEKGPHPRRPSLPALRPAKPRRDF